MRTTKLLSTLEVKNLTDPGAHHVGNGLYLQITKGGSRSWLYNYNFDKKPRSMGLGSASTMTLAEARAAAAECRKQRNAGIDPLAAKQARAVAAQVAAAHLRTFAECAEDWFDVNRTKWTVPGTEERYRRILQSYAYPVFGTLPVGAVTLPLVLKVLKPIWGTRTADAINLRAHIEGIIDLAVANGHRDDGRNPAQWKGVLKPILPTPTSFRRPEPHPALHYRDAPDLLRRLRQQTPQAALVAEFALFTAVRAGEAVGAAWSEFDLEHKLWTIPKERMKKRREHVVPLTDPVLDILRDCAAVRCGPWVFDGRNGSKKHFAVTSIGRHIREMKLPSMTPGRNATLHGLRATFGTWVMDKTTFGDELKEAALAHLTGSESSRRYNHGTMLERRRVMMEAWANYCQDVAAAANVVPFLAACRTDEPVERGEPQEIAAPAEYVTLKDAATELGFSNPDSIYTVRDKMVWKKVAGLFVIERASLLALQEARGAVPAGYVPMKEAAAALGLSPDSTYWMKSKLVCKKVAGKLFVERASLLALQEARKARRA